MDDPDGMALEFTGAIWHWRGPAPYYFVTVPEEECGYLRELSGAVTYGWGMIPVRAQVGSTEWKTSLFPKDTAYVVPLKDAVRRAENLAEHATISVRLAVGGRP